MLNPNKSGIRNAIIDHMSATFSAWKGDSEQQPYLLFITIVFNGNSAIPNVKSVSEVNDLPFRLKYVKRHFNKAYCALCRALLGSHFHRRSMRAFQPLAWVFPDLPGTKRKKGVIGQSQRLGLHLHVPMLIHPRTIRDGSIEEIAQTVRASMEEALVGAVQGVDVRAVTDDVVLSIRKLVSYSCALFFKRVPDEVLWECYDVWPQM